MTARAGLEPIATIRCSHCGAPFRGADSEAAFLHDRICGLRRSAARATRDDAIPECELRALWGDR